MSQKFEQTVSSKCVETTIPRPQTHRIWTLCDSLICVVFWLSVTQNSGEMICQKVKKDDEIDARQMQQLASAFNQRTKLCMIM